MKYMSGCVWEKEREGGKERERNCDLNAESFQEIIILLNFKVKLA